MIIKDFSDSVGAFNFIHDLLVPRPVFLIGTTSADKQHNVAPFSYVTCLGHDPLLIGITVLAGDDGREKDTLRNLRETGDFTANSVNLAIIEQANRCGEKLPHGESEFEFSGLTPEASQLIQAPRVVEAPFTMECSVREIVKVGDNNLVIGEVVALHINQPEWALEGSRLAIEGLGLVGRFGIDQYIVAKDPLRLQRPTTGDIGAPE